MLGFVKTETRSPVKTFDSALSCQTPSAHVLSYAKNPQQYDGSMSCFQNLIISEVWRDPFFFSLVFFFFFFAFSRAAPAACGGSQARGLIGAVATGLRQSHSNMRSQPHLRPTPQLTATPDP